MAWGLQQAIGEADLVEHFQGGDARYRRGNRDRSPCAPEGVTGTFFRQQEREHTPPAPADDGTAGLLDGSPLARGMFAHSMILKLLRRVARRMPL